MYKKLYLLILVLFSSSSILKIYAQEPQTTKLMASYTKMSDGTKKIKATLLAMEEKGKSPVEGSSINVYVAEGENPTLLGSVATNYKGVATFIIPKTAHLPKDAEGNYNFNVKFDGDTKYASAEGSVSVKDVQLELIIDPLDTAKNIKAVLYETDDKGGKKVIPDVDVEFDIKRLFCNYGFATVKTDSSGSSYTVFPDKMPGDTTGEVTVLARLVDNETYASVESSVKVKWGVPLIISEHHKRGLGDTDAPLWMVYTLIVLLSGVWLHFLYIIFSILKINRIGIKMLKKSAASV